MSAPKVKITRAGKYFVLRWQDPLTGRICQRSAKTDDQAEALTKAAALEEDLRAGREIDRYKMTWAELRERFEAEKLPSLAPKSRNSYGNAMNAFEKRMRPFRLIDITALRMSEFQTRLRRDKLSEMTIAAYLRQLKAIFGWAVTMGLMDEVPRIQMPKRGKGTKVMKGRPLTQDEFQELLDTVEEVVEEKHVASWKHYLEGMWWSGLRVGESLELAWDSSGGLMIDLTDEFPVLRISAECEKGHQERVHPIAPEFVNWLLKTPERKRSGFVFSPGPFYGGRPRVDTVSKLGARIGRQAKIVVNQDRRTGQPRFASLHDFRRSFGERWAGRLLPQELQQLMRHESIDTTLRFYVGKNAQRMAKVLWKAFEQENRQFG